MKKFSQSTNYKNLSFYELVRELWIHISFKRRIEIGILFVLMLISSFAEIVSIGAVLPFLSVLIQPENLFANPNIHYLREIMDINSPNELILPLTILFACSALISGFMRWLLLLTQTRLGFAIGAELSISIYNRTLYQPYSVHLARNSSEVISGISIKANQVVQNALIPILTILSSAIMLIFILITLAAIEPKVAFSIFFVFGLIYLVVILLTQKKLKQNSLCISIQHNLVIKALQEGLGGIRDVLLDGTQDVYSKVYSSAVVPLRRAMANVQIISNSPRFAIESLGMVFIAFFSYYLTKQPGGINSAIPILGAIALGAQRLLPVMQQSYSAWTSIKGSHSSLVDALYLINQPYPENSNKSNSFPIHFEREIQLNKISFSYTNVSPFILKEIDLKILKGSVIGIIGDTGSGKSTLIDLIMGLLISSKGSLKVDGIEVNSINLRSWQSHIAHVPQNVFLSDSTIAENIAFGVPLSKIDFNRVRIAANKAQIADTIENWDKQYDTFVGERGVRLSGGQRQRIAIARAFYKNADVIIFDEATSALDNDTENAVMQSIEMLGAAFTVILIAHRLTTLKKCTEIIRLHNGIIQKIGSYQDLIK